jgi:Kef-type K+ transport system membrane component KefB
MSRRPSHQLPRPQSKPCPFCVAFTGIALPICLSYTLQALLDATAVQAFAAGAALCSTSLGTTFTVLSSSGLGSSRLGVVLTSAAMMDDVGLVMVQVISNLGGDNFSAVTIIRPVLVSLAFAVTVPVACLFVVGPATVWLNRYRGDCQSSGLNAVLCRTQTVWAIHTALLIVLITGATYAGTSNLFAAYIAGACVSWWDSEVPHPVSHALSTGEMQHSQAGSTGGASTGDLRESHAASTQSPTINGKLCGQAIYEQYYHPAVSKIMQPFFFASIGFSIPITRMFRAAIVWRGIVYTALMGVAKMVCGLWLARPSSSFHPPLILGLAMCARGEIGFLISGVAESKGIFSGSGSSPNEPSDIFLVVTWAIVVCTIIGPLGVGLCVRRVKKLQGGKGKEQEDGGRDVLGGGGRINRKMVKTSVR